jgi:hypothetical protein
LVHGHRVKHWEQDVHGPRDKPCDKARIKLSLDDGISKIAVSKKSGSRTADKKDIHLEITDFIYFFDLL